MNKKKTYEALERRIAELEEMINDAVLQVPESCLTNESHGSEPENRVGIERIELSRILDVQKVQALSDDLYNLTRMPLAILDLEGNVLVQSGWQDICTKFHRVHPETCRYCLESDLELTKDIEPGTFKLYQCKNNLWDMATPLIVGTRHVGNLYLGQFLLKDEVPDLKFFRLRAQQYGFVEKDYLDALARVPRWSRDAITTAMNFYAGFAHLISDLSYKNFMLKRSETFSSNLLNGAPHPIVLINPDTSVGYVNPAFEKLTGFSSKEIVDRKTPYPWWTENTLEKTSRDFAEALTAGAQGVEEQFQRKNGEPFRVEITSESVTGDRGVPYYLANWVDITERKRAEDALIESEQKWRNILMETPQIGIALDPRSGITFANDHFLSLTGWEKQEIMGRNWFDTFIPEKTREQVRKVFARVMGQKETLGFSNFENEIITKFGLRRNVMWSNVLTKDVDGNVVEVTCLGVDLTERKQMQNELERTLAATTDGIWWWNFKTGELRFSSRYYTMLGYEPDAFPADFETWQNLVHPDDFDTALGVAKAYLKTKSENYENEFRMRTQSGAYRWIHARGRIVEKEENGEPVLMVGNHEDITEKKEAIDKLKLNEERLSLALRGANDGLWDWNMETDEVFYSPRWKEMLGYEDHEIKNHFSEWERLTLPESRDRAWKILNEYLEGRREKFECEMQCRHKNGGVVEILSRAFAIRRTSDNNPIRVIGTHVDVTDRKKMEEKLQQAQKMESIGNLAGGIAHDFNNILFPIVGISELLLDDFPAGSLEHENVRQILKAGQRGSDLVQQILAFSRRYEHKMMPVGVQKILKEVLKLVRSTIPSNIEIVQEIQANCGLVMADPVQLHQIAMNLITNAYHAVAEGGGKIAVQLKETRLGVADLPDSSLGPGSYAMLSVSDTGCGIDPVVMDKVFDPYFTTKAQGKGTGLGLAVVYGIVKEHRGDIKVHSELGKGSVFDVYIPIIEKSSNPVSTERVQKDKTGTERILLVDDEESILGLEKQMLERLGYQVTTRLGSMAALDAFRKDPDAFDLVLTDMAMPDMTGDQLAEELISMRPDIPIIISTGFSEQINKEKAEAMGIKGFLMKPAAKSVLAERVRKVLDEAKTEGLRSGDNGYDCEP